MAFAKGHNHGGRQKGAKNKFTKQFKDLLTETYEALEANEDRKEGDPETGMLVWAKEHPTDFYRICAKLIPLQITGEGGNPIEVQHYIMPDGSKLEFR